MKSNSWSWLVGALVAAAVLGAATSAVADSGADPAANAAQAAPQNGQGDPQRAELTAVIQDWVAAVNREDGPAVTRRWTRDNTIIDSFPPYVWQGPQAIGTWWADYQSLKTSQGLKDVLFVFEPRHVDVVGERAYVVGDAVVDYTLTAGRLRDRATWTFCLERRDGLWVFSAWAWGHLERSAAPGN